MFLQIQIENRCPKSSRRFASRLSPPLAVARRASSLPRPLIVLTNSQLKGFSLGVDKKNIVEEITRAYAHQIFIDGFFNADPDPGILVISL